jgi:hypothetical protein
VLPNNHPNEYRLISLSGGGYRAALFNAGALRALDSAGLLDDSNLIVNAVSGSAIPAMLWEKYLAAHKKKAARAWPETSLLSLVSKTPRFGGQYNWQLRGGWFRATRAWHGFLENWWSSLEQLPQGLGNEPKFFVEALDYQRGQLWLYCRGRFSHATRDLLRDRTAFLNIKVSKMAAVAAATAFPLAFQGLPVTDEKNRRVASIRDAGLIDNVAIMPLLHMIKKDAQGETFGTVKHWIISNAGKPLPVTVGFEGTQTWTVGNSQLVGSLGLFDRISRLTGDLAQPQFEKLLTDILHEYVGIHFTAVAIGLSIGDDKPWISKAEGDPEPARMRTALEFVPRSLALSVMSEGAQAMSKALAAERLMTQKQQEDAQRFLSELA